jgi:hypothetical protein
LSKIPVAKKNRATAWPSPKKPGPVEKPAKRSAGKSLMNCLCREAKAEFRMQNEIWRDGKPK